MVIVHLVYNHDFQGSKQICRDLREKKHDVLKHIGIQSGLRSRSPRPGVAAPSSSSSRQLSVVVVVVATIAVIAVLLCQSRGPRAVGPGPWAAGGGEPGTAGAVTLRKNRCRWAAGGIAPAPVPSCRAYCGDCCV